MLVEITIWGKLIYLLSLPIHVCLFLHLFRTSLMSFISALQFSKSFKKLQFQKFYTRFVIFTPGLDPCLLYNVMNLSPQFIRHSVYQIQSLKSISYFHCIVIRDFIQVIPEWSSGFLHFLQFQSEFGNNLGYTSRIEQIYQSEKKKKIKLNHGVWEQHSCCQVCCIPLFKNSFIQ